MGCAGHFRSKSTVRGTIIPKSDPWENKIFRIQTNSFEIIRSDQVLSTLYKIMNLNFCPVNYFIFKEYFLS